MPNGFLALSFTLFLFLVRSCLFFFFFFCRYNTLRLAQRGQLCITIFLPAGSSAVPRHHAPRSLSLLPLRVAYLTHLPSLPLLLPSSSRTRIASELATAPSASREHRNSITTTRGSVLPDRETMDKIPKLRRKPKPPTIETTVDRTSTDTSESALSTSNNYNTVAETQSPSGARRQHSSEWFKSKTSSSSSASRKKSPFRLIRPSAKRAREDSPAADSSSAAGGSPQQRLQVPGQGGAKFPRNGAGGGGSSRPSTLAADDEETSSVDGVAVFADPGPQMPGFLKLTNQGGFSSHVSTRWTLEHWC